MKILVLAGGASNEHEVSIRSGEAVAAALRSKQHEVTVLDPADGLTDFGHPDVVFLALHGKGGEDGTIQAVLEKQGLAYTGCDAAVSALCFDKWTYKQMLLEHNIKTPEGALVNKDTIWHSPFAKKPFVLKPIRGGSSIDTFIVRDVRLIDKPHIEKALEGYDEMLLEELIPGIELTAGVLNKQALPIVEIVPPSNGEFDYENKYNGMTQELCPPRNISEDLQARARNLALKTHQLLGCRDLSRTDMIISPEGQLIVLETNTLPGMTNQSLFPKAAAAKGIDMAELVDRLARMAASRIKVTA